MLHPFEMIKVEGESRWIWHIQSVRIPYPLLASRSPMANSTPFSSVLHSEPPPNKHTVFVNAVKKFQKLFGFTPPKRTDPQPHDASQSNAAQAEADRAL
jgi:hypothetical protein